MRSSLLVAVLFGIACLPVGAVAQTTAVPRIAPVDEYFGESSESILEIRNRLADVESKSDADARTATTVAAIDYFEEALVDWQHKYPTDPWVADVLSRTVRCYARAGAANSTHAAEMYAVLTKSYPHSTAVDRAIYAMYYAPAAETPTTMARVQDVPIVIP